MNKRRKILVFSGAGISAESGIATFRDAKESLWNNHKVEEVASIEGFQKNPQLVLDFYNHRRREILNASPNEGHHVIKSLEKDFDVIVVTQNVDDLHERAGSKDILHLHGEILKSQSLIDGTINDCLVDITIEDQKRPSIVWFGEGLDQNTLDKAKEAADDADVCIIVGTSMMVWPANTLPFLTKHTCLIYFVNPAEIDFHIPSHRKPYFTHIQDKGTTGLQTCMDDIINTFTV